MASDSRARLISYLCQAGLSTGRANAVLDDFAHELAEKQRAIPMGAPPAARVRDLVADAIDPEMT